MDPETKKKRIVYILVGIVVLSVIAMLSGLPGAPDRPLSVARGDAIGVIYIEGPFYGGRSTSSVFGSSLGSDNVMAYLRQAQTDPSIKAVVLRMNSPGGSPAAADEIALQVRKLRQSGKVVVTSMGDMAASGAYWIASGTDKIWASRSTITGSIGVVWELVRVEELYRKLGIEVDVIKSGPHKDIGSSVRDMQEEERQILQDLVDDVFEQFVTQIVEGRDMQRQDVIKLADGRIFSGRQAHELGLVDELGNFDDAVRDAARLSGLSAWHIKEYGRLSPLERLLAGQVRAPELPGAQELTGNRVLDIAWILRQMLMIPSSQPTK